MGALQHIQGRIAAAEIIHPDREAKRFKAVDLHFYEFKITADHTFRDLDNNFIPRNSGDIHPSADLFHKVAYIKIRTGEVDGNRHHIQAF